MEKLILKDKTIINVEGGTTANTFVTIVQGTEAVKVLLDNLTEDNLSNMQLQNEAGLVCAVLENKVLSNVNVVSIPKTSNWKVTVMLTDKDPLLMRVEALESGQALQDNAIADMSTTVYA